MSLDTLPLTLCRLVLSFVGNDVPAMLAVERTCRTLKKAVADDGVWHGRSFKWDDRLRTNRSKACTAYALQLVRNTQEQFDNLFEDYSEHFSSIMVIISEIVRMEHEVLVFRPDAVGVWAEILQATLIDLLHDALQLSCEIADEKGEYPILEKRHLWMITHLRNFKPTLLKSYNLLMNWVSELNPNYMRPRLPDELILELSRRAGVVHLATDAYEAVRTLILFYTKILLQTVTEDLERAPPVECDEMGRVLLKAHQGPRDVPTPPVLDWCEGCEAEYYTYSIVPGQIERAARRLELPVTKVYGHVWFGHYDGCSVDVYEDIMEKDYVYMWNDETEDISMVESDDEMEKVG